jgi:hypothetical protein
LMFLVFLLCIGVSNSQISLTTIGSAYTQDFNSLTNSGTTSTTMPSGWVFNETGTGANTTYTIGTGSGTGGDTYSFGATSSTDRALGGLQSGSVVPTIGASFTNNTSTTITSIDISYFGEQWRLGATGRVDRLDFQYSLDATSLTTGAWTDVNLLDFTAPVTTGSTGVLDGNAAGNRTSISNSITGLSIPNGAIFWIRWTDFNASGSDDGLGVDDFSLTPIGASLPEPTNHPTTFVCSAVSPSNIDLSWTDANGGQEPQGYLIKWSNISYADITDPTDGSTANGVNSTTVAQGVGATTIASLNQNTTYYFKIFPYTNSGASIDYKVNGTIQQTDCTTDEVPCGSESFGNNNAPGNTYASGSFVGDDVYTWEYVQARTPDATNSISGTSIGFNDSGTGYVRTIGSGGIGDLTFSIRSYFTGGAASDRTLQVWINGSMYGSYTLPSMGVVYTYNIPNINLTGSIPVEFRSTGTRQIVLDDIFWSCYTNVNNIMTDAVSSLTFEVDCDTDDFGIVDFSTTGNFAAGNIFTVQLSNSNGVFINPTTIGSLGGAAAEGIDPFGTIDVTIPAGTVQGNLYRIRVVSSSPTSIGSDNGSDITINYVLCPAQLPTGQGLLINEFSNGAGGAKEYYEFVVAGRCGQLADIRGYIVDDNNGTFSTTFPSSSTSGVANGHLRLSNDAQWASIPVGSLIVIYNAGDPNASLPADDPNDFNNDSLYVIPHNHPTLFEITNDLPIDPSDPSLADSTYTPAIYDQIIWGPLGLANIGDAVQIRLPNGNYFHGVSYGDPNITGGPNNMKIYNGNMSGMVGWFNSGDILNANNWDVGLVAGNETPGLPNNSANLAWLRLMRDPFTEVCPVVPLPITLINLTGKFYNGSTHLSWQTVSEQNNDHFTLSHSTNGLEFEQIGTVNGAGNSSQLLEYNFIHERPSRGINYYKLSSTDYDGTTYHKGIVSVLVDGEGTYFDPFTAQLKFGEKSDYTVYSSDGKKLGEVWNQESMDFQQNGFIIVQNLRKGTIERLFIP